MSKVKSGSHDGYILHSFREQQESRAKHPNYEALSQLESLIAEELVQVLGAYFRSDEMGIFTKRSVEEPAILAREIGSSVGKSVAGILGINPQWPTDTTSEVPHRREVLVLRSDEVKRVAQLDWYMLAAYFSRLSEERAERPGWEWRWLHTRLKSIGAYAGIGPNAATAPNLKFVLVRKDGSGFIQLLDGETKEFMPLEQKEWLPQVVTRKRQRSPNLNLWRSEFTHQLVNGEWVRIEPTEREEN